MLDNPLAPIDLSDSANNAVKNITDEPTKNIGTTIADCWFLVFGGISQVAQKRRLKYAQDLEQYHSELNKAISSIPEPNRIEPSIQITTQALENSKYCVSEEELRKLFINLISSSVDSSRVSSVHPCFAEIIKQMSSLDAKILQEIPLKSPFPIVDYISEENDTHYYDTELSHVFFSHSTECDLFKSSNAISSLMRLGLISLNTDQYITDDNVYSPLSNTDFFKNFSREVEERSKSHKAEIKKYCGFLTPLGQNFVMSCVYPSL